MRTLYKYIIEGGAAGHMAHPYDYTNFTLRELKGLIRNLFTAKVEEVTEKIDGMNIVATVNNKGEIVFIRNKSDLNSVTGGMSLDDMSRKWSGKDKILNTFTTAGEIITKVLSKIDKKFFNPDETTRVAVNCECVSGKTNIIPYGSSQVDFHNLFIYKLQDGQWTQVDTTKSGLEEIGKACDDIDNAQITPNIIIKTTEESKQILVNFIKEIDRIFKSRNCKEYDTIDTWKRKGFKNYCKEHEPWILKEESGMNILYSRWFDDDKPLNIRQIKQLYKNYDDDIDRLDKKEYKKIINTVMEPIDIFFGNLGNAIIRQCDGFINSGIEDEVISRLRQETEDVIDYVHKNGSIEANDKLSHHLNRLYMLGNEINPVEGIVFRYKGKLMKCTGSFAALNQMLNIKYMDMK